MPSRREPRAIRKLSGPPLSLFVMSRASQTKRAARAKDRARQRAHEKHRANQSGPAAPGSRSGWNDPYQGSPFGVPGGPGRAPRRRRTREILNDARDAAPLGPLLNEASAIDPATFFAETETALVSWTLELYGSGWQPTELIRVARLRRASAGAELVRLAVAAERASREGPTASDPRWVQQ